MTAERRRIQELQREVDRLDAYRGLACDLFDTLTKLAVEGKTLNQQWIIQQYRRVFK